MTTISNPTPRSMFGTLSTRPTDVPIGTLYTDTATGVVSQFQPSGWVVVGGGGGTGSGLPYVAGPGAQYATIQAAANAAAAGGGTVLVLPKPGPFLDPSTFYNEAPTLGEGVSMVGIGDAAQILITGMLTVASLDHPVLIENVTVLEMASLGVLTFPSTAVVTFRNCNINPQGSTPGNPGIRFLSAGGSLLLDNTDAIASVGSRGIDGSVSIDKLSVWNNSMVKSGGAGLESIGVFQGASSVSVKQSTLIGHVETTNVATFCAFDDSNIQLDGTETAVVFGFAGSSYSFRGCRISGAAANIELVSNAGSIYWGSNDTNVPLRISIGVNTNQLFQQRTFLGMSVGGGTLIQGTRCTFVNDPGTNVMTLAAAGGDTIDGVASKAYNASGAIPINAVTLEVVGTNWRQIGTSIKV